MSDRIELTLAREGFCLNVAFDLPGPGVLALLGPSGGGKSSLLRALAGLEPTVRGRIRVAGQHWLHSERGISRPPQRRSAGLVFQDYALFEHMNVYDNVGFGVPRHRRTQVVQQWLQALQLTGLEARLPRRLSGGQRQRVALARALAHEPDMLLLDEPLSAIDVPLRQQLRTQLQAVFIGLTKPVLLVSHDLEETRQLADFVGVLVDGRMHQLGTTAEVFQRPQTVAAARVLGWRNLLAVTELQGRYAGGSWGRVHLTREVSLHTVALGIRPECVSLLPPGQGVLQATVVRINELGAIRELQCRLADGCPFYIQRLWSDPLPAPGSRVGLELPLQHLVCLRGTPAVSPDAPVQPARLGASPSRRLGRRHAAAV
jgi:molybdate transport system ATP-binding protein